MNQSKWTSAALACLLSSGALAYKGVTYDETSRQLTVPTVRIGDRWYNNLVVRIDSAELVAYSSTSRADTLPEAGRCPHQLKQSQLAAIAPGMTLDQVDTIVGCQHAPLFYGEPITSGAPDPVDVTVQWWGSGLSYILVTFDREGKQVVANTALYKRGAFLAPD